MTDQDINIDERLAVIKLMMNSNRGRRNNQGFLTRDQAKVYAQESRRITEGHITINGSEYYHFYTDNHCFGYQDEKNKLICVPISSSLPMSATPREGLESGRITTLEEHEIVFGKDSTLINDFNELVDFIVKHKLYVSEKM